MLADFQMVFGDITCLVVVNGRVLNGTFKREIINDKSEKIISITYSTESKWKSEIFYENLVRGYKLTISTLEFSSL